MAYYITGHGWTWMAMGESNLFIFSAGVTMTFFSKSYLLMFSQKRYVKFFYVRFLINKS